MFKKIVTYFLVAVAAGLFATYFAFASYLRESGAQEEVCTSVQVTILDSALNRFVSKDEVKEILSSSKSKPIGQNIRKINLTVLEKLLNGRSAIRKSDVSITRDGTLYVSITQRKPMLRIQTANGGFYVDDTEYVFPLVNTFTSYVPVVTGNIPIKIKEGYRGDVREEDKKWLHSIMQFGNYLSKNEFWNAQIQQIYIQENGDALLYTMVGDQTINFGGLDNIPHKFRKLDSYYQNIVPVYGWNHYREINLKYKNQLVCTPREKQQKQ